MAKENPSNNLSTYQQITTARQLLELPERADMATIKHSYRALLKQWHPDTCGAEPHRCVEMTRKITEAYTIIVAYCNEYEFSFSKEEVARHKSPEEWWANRFSDISW